MIDRVRWWQSVQPMFNWRGIATIGDITGGMVRALLSRGSQVRALPGRYFLRGCIKPPAGGFTSGRHLFRRRQERA